MTKNKYIFQNCSHAVMFHHFHGKLHSKIQGSINQNELIEIILFLKQNYNLINANYYSEKVFENKLEKNDICLTFDDALKCQYDIAFPILEEFKLTAFFFVYSSPFFKNPDYLEIFRYFRNNCFININDFYSHFFNLLIEDKSINYFLIKKKFNNLNYLSSFPFYTSEDRWFRYLRDLILGKEKYNEIMLKMINLKGFNIKDSCKNLWMSSDDISTLQSSGNVIGLHSFTHPTMMEKLSCKEQESEYFRNLQHLKKDLKINNIISMSHPCGKYNKNTLHILNKLGIKIGFRSSLSIKHIKSNLEIPREDHSNILKIMRQND